MSNEFETEKPNYIEHEKLSKAEVAKIESKNLRGTISEVLADESKDSFDHDDLISLKFHGIYQQDDRDTRMARVKAGEGKEFSLMIRISVPGGRCTADQYIAIDDLAGKHGGDKIRLTTRQAFQLHGIIKGELKETMAGINKSLLHTIATCGDIPRNMMASPAPYADEIHQQVYQMSVDLADDLRPATGGYREIWIDGERTTEFDDDFIKNEEPFYGQQYLPRKFKIGVAIDFDNSIDLYAYDAGLIAVTENGKIIGYQVIAGGGLGMKHNKPDTIARMASPIAFVAPEHGVAAIRTVVAIFRDHGERGDRVHARLKYLLEKWGVEKFQQTFAEYATFPHEPPRELQRPTQLDHIGRFEQGDGKEFLGVWVQNGRISDANELNGGVNYRTAFRKIVETLKPTVILTPMQSIIFGDLEPAQVDEAIAILKENKVPTVDDLSNARRYSMACPALPTCGLALTEAERVHPSVVEDIDKHLTELNLQDVPLTIRMTGCPNGCARPYNADIGLVGKKPGQYQLYVGGGLAGNRLADLFAADVKQETVADTLRPLLERFSKERQGEENLSDYYHRAFVGSDDRTILTGREEPTSELYQLTVSS